MIDQDKPKKFEYLNKYTHSEHAVDAYETPQPVQIDPELLYQRLAYWELQAKVAETMDQRSTAHYHARQVRIKIREKYGDLLEEPPVLIGHLKAHRFRDYYGRTK